MLCTGSDLDRSTELLQRGISGKVWLRCLGLSRSEAAVSEVAGIFQCCAVAPAPAGTSSAGRAAWP